MQSKPCALYNIESNFGLEYSTTFEVDFNVFIRICKLIFTLLAKIVISSNFKKILRLFYKSLNHFILILPNRFLCRSVCCLYHTMSSSIQKIGVLAFHDLFSKDKKPRSNPMPNINAKNRVVYITTILYLTLSRLR